MREIVSLIVISITFWAPVMLGQETGTDAEPDVNVQMPVLSAYDWRGQLINDEAVCQPYVSITRFGFTASAWGNYNLTDQGELGHEFTEIDLTLSYQIPVDFAEFTVGVVDYLSTVAGVDPLHEVFVVAEYTNAWVTPRVEAYRSYNDYVGYYILAGLSRDFDIGEKWTVTGDVSSGFGSSKWNDYSFGVEGSAINDGSVSLSLEYSITEALSIVPSVRYVWLWDSDIKTGAEEVFPSDEPDDSSVFIAGVALDYYF